MGFAALCEKFMVSWNCVDITSFIHMVMLISVWKTLWYIETVLTSLVWAVWWCAALFEKCMVSCSCVGCMVLIPAHSLDNLCNHWFGCLCVLGVGMVVVGGAGVNVLFILLTQWSCWGGILVSLHPSVRPSARPSCIWCLLCSTYSSCWTTRQLQKVCNL